MTRTNQTTEGNGTDDGTHSNRAGQASPHLIEALVCPASGTRLTWDSESQELISKAAGLAYPVRDGIPIMLIDEARKTED